MCSAIFSMKTLIVKNYFIHQNGHEVEPKEKSMPPQEPSLIVRLLSKYDYPTKFIFISILFIFSILVSNYFMISSQYEKISFAETELLGARYEANLRKLLETIIKHQLYSIKGESKEPAVRSELAVIQQEASSNFTNVKVLDADLEDKLNTTASDFQQRGKAYLRPAELEAKWNDLVKEANEIKGDHSPVVHERILNDIVGLIRYISDFSNLYLDPFMDSTYLADANFVIIPNIQVLIPKLLIRIDAIARSGATTLSIEDRFVLTSIVAMLE